jgi:transposase
MLDRRTVFEIHRLRNEGYSLREISRKLLISRETVKKYLLYPDPVPAKRPRASKLSAYYDLINELLQEWPQAKATVILQRIKAAGYTGEITILRDYLKKIRGQIKNRQAFIRFESGPGEQMQIDWGHFGALSCGETKRKLYALAVIESHSRMIYVEFTHSQKQETLHQSLLNAFKFFGGCPDEIVVDNMLTAVIERQGSLIRFNESFLDFLRPFSITPKACNVRAPHEKGKIERMIQYLRQNFWPLRKFNSLGDVQDQAIKWLNEEANVRVHQTTGQRPVERFSKESLKPLPEFMPDCRETLEILVHKDFSVRFDGNSYTTPPWTVGKRLILKADQNQITIYWKHNVAAAHKRCWSRRQRIELPQHKEMLKKIQKKLWQDRNIATFASLGPIARDYLDALGRANQPIRKNVDRLLRLKGQYGTPSLLAVIEKAMKHKAYGAEYVENILYQQMAPKNVHPPVKLKNDNLNNITLTEPNLAEYDGLVLQRRKKNHD